TPPPPPPPRPRKPKLRRKILAPPPLTPAERAAAEAHLATQRLASQSRLKDAWESIFERYSQDFDGVADEIDTLTGEMIVSLEAVPGEEGKEGEWIDEECLECKDRDELDDSFCRSCGGGGDGGRGIFSTPFGASIVTPAKTPRSSPPEIVPLPLPLPKAKAADPKDWLVGDVSEWMCALIGLSPDEVVDLRERVVGSGVTGGYLLKRLRFDDLKEILGIASFSKRMELWNEVLKLRGAFTSGRGGGGIVDSSPCLPMPVSVVGSLEGDIDADTPTHAGRGKPLAKGGKGKKKVMVVGLVSPRMASAGASDTPKQKWRGNAEGASPGLGSLDRTPDTISTTIATATPTRSIKHQGKAKKLPSPTTSIASTSRPTAKQQHSKRQESPDIITTSTPASSTTTTIKTPKQKPKPKAATPLVSAVARTPLPPRTPASNTNPWAPPPPASDPFYSPIWNDEHPDGTPAKFPSSEMRLPLTLPLEPKLTPKPQPTPATATTKNEAKRKRRSVSTTAAATTNTTTTTRPRPTSTSIRKPRPFLTPAPPKRKRSSSTTSATIGWTTDAKKRQKLSGRSFLKFGSGEDELSSGGSSPAERGSLRQKKGIIVDRESVEAGAAEKVHKCCGRGFCFGCLDLEGEEDDLV
ncbi:hypothetical protein B9Z19DRAFT_1095478, partial [Tuber borchii]